MLAAFFLIDAVVNWIAPQSIKGDYQRWKYPRGFNYVTAIVEGVAAVLLLVPSTAIFGAGLACAVMVAAVITVLMHKEYGRAIAPGIALTASLVCLLMLI